MDKSLNLALLILRDECNKYDECTDGCPLYNNHYGECNIRSSTPNHWMFIDDDEED